MTSGENIGHYKVLSQLGKGGMGEVYLAEDTKLQRQVALKVLPESVKDDPDRLARFRREALAVAKLNHPNVAQVYAFEDIDEVLFIAMEYVPGKPLNELIPKNGLDIDKFFDWFIPLSDGLAHAHENQITHRDLKPSNIMIREDGVPKILDFGLARITLPPNPTTEADSQTPTQTMDANEIDYPLTVKPQFMGTPQYMSPEQTSLQELDHRTDLFSFGIILYESLTGQRPFQGNSQPEIVSSILKDTPVPVREVKPELPYRVDQIVMRCLRKERRNRYQSALDLRHDLGQVSQEFETGGNTDTPDIHAVQKPIGRRLIPTISIMILIALISMMATWHLKPRRDLPLRKSRFAVAPPEGRFCSSRYFSRWDHDRNF